MARLSREELERKAGGRQLEDLTPTEVSTIISAGTSTLFALDRNIDILKAFADDVKAGKKTIGEFFQQAQPFAAEANRLLNASGAEGFGRIPDIRKFAQLDTPSGLGQFQDVKLPFSQREFATLPEDVLPSLDEIDRGLIPVDLLPPGSRERVQRVSEERIAQQPPQPITPTPPPAQPEVGQIVPQPRVQPQPTEPLLPVRPPTIGVEDPTRPGTTIPVPIVGDVTGIVPPQTPDQAIIEAEARRQEEQQRRAFEAARALRGQSLEETAQLLAGERERSFQQFLPTAAEQLQTKGLLQTRELEDALAREQARLTGETEAVLGQARLAGTQQEIEDINRILAQRQSLQQSGLERRFSVQDFERQLAAARQLGAEATPQVGGQGSRLGSTLTGAVGGASALAGLGPVGAVAGGLLGAAGGSASARGK